MIRALALCLCLAAPAVAAQTDAARLARDAADRLAAAEAALAETEGSRDRIGALTRAIRAYEDGLAALREGQRRARTREAVVAAELQSEEARVGALLSSLSSLAATPEAAMLLHPGGPEPTIRAAMLMRDLTPALLSEVEAVRDRLAEIEELRAVQTRVETTLQGGLDGLADARARLSRAVADRTDLPRRVTDDAAQMMRLAQSVDSLRALADGLPDLPQDAVAAAQPDFDTGRGSLPWPVRGSLRRVFGEPDGAGIVRDGWVIETQPGALVTAPWPATVRYAGPLLDYGNVMLLEPDEGYLVVLAGLDTVYGDPGLVLPAGAPLGAMPGAEGAAMAGFSPNGATGIDAALAEAHAPTLYVEVRHDSIPQDPADWFRPEEG